MIALIVFGVLLMHSVTPTTSMDMGFGSSSGHPAMASTTSPDGSGPVAYGANECPTEHQMMHPCMGITVLWPALTVTAKNVDIEESLLAADNIDTRTVTAWGRAPPWTLWELDRSVTLRV